MHVSAFDLEHWAEGPNCVGSKEVLEGTKENNEELVRCQVRLSF